VRVTRTRRMNHIVWQQAHSGVTDEAATKIEPVANLGDVGLRRPAGSSSKSI
jgi:hypothetical protein